MDTITVGCREIVAHFRATFEAVLRGQVVIITHYRRPRAALVPFEVWQQFQAAGAAPEPAPPDRPPEADR